MKIHTCLIVAFSVFPFVGNALEAQICVGAKGTHKDFMNKSRNIDRPEGHIQNIIKLGSETIVQACYIDKNNATCDVMYVSQDKVLKGDRYKSVGKAYILETYTDGSFEAILGDTWSSHIIINGRCFRKEKGTY